MKKIYIITLTFNTNKQTKEWLESFIKLSVPKDVSLDFVIVDNGSTNPFKLEEKFTNNKNIHLLRSNENTGFTGGNNIGIEFALKKDADYVMVVNNDATPDKELLKNLLSSLDSNLEIGAVVPKIYFAKGYEYHKNRYTNKELGNVLWYAGGDIDWAHVQGVHRGVDEVDHGQYDRSESIPFGTGCCMLLKREVLEKVGMFDTRYFLYFEDLDLSYRIQKAGWKIIYVPQARLWHSNASSSGGAGAQLHDYFLTRNRMIFGIAYAPIRTKIALLRESIRLRLKGRPMQKRGIQDYFLKRFGKGTFLINRIA